MLTSGMITALCTKPNDFKSFVSHLIKYKQRLLPVYGAVILFAVSLVIMFANITASTALGAVLLLLSFTFILKQYTQYELQLAQAEGSEAILRSLANQKEEPLLVMDKHGQIVFYNESAVDKVYGIKHGKDGLSLLTASNVLDSIQQEQLSQAMTADISHLIESSSAYNSNIIQLVPIDIHLNNQHVGNDHKLFALYILKPANTHEHGLYQEKEHVAKLADRGASEIMQESGNISYSMLESYFEQSPIAELILHRDGTVDKCNPAFLALTNVGNYHDGWNFLDIVHENYKNEAMKLIQDALFIDNAAKQNIKPIEIKILGDKGPNTLLYINSMVDDYGNSPKLICRLINISEQKNLEMHVAHSQKMQAVGQLAGGIAHDFNNLLTAIIGFCDLLLMRHPPGDHSFADIMQIKQNSNRAANLVRQLLAFSRKQVLHPEVIDITGVLDELSNLIRRLIGENIELNIQHGKDLRLIKVDQMQLEQVIMNLAVNARDAMQNGGVLTIRTSNVDIDANYSLDSSLIPASAEEGKIDPGEYVLIEVEDQGCGIPKELISKIFEPFFSTKEVSAGTGLGLSTVYGIVRQTGGYIYVDTERDQGTKFSMFFKSYSNKYERPQANQDQDITDKLQVMDLTGSGTILLVEDEAPVRIFAAHALMNKGYKVLEAENGDAAFAMVDKHGPEINVIITDVIMPGLNGPVMIEEIMRTYPQVKVIFISGYAEDAFVKTYGSERKFNFLAKPFSLKQLASKVKEVLTKELVD